MCKEKGIFLFYSGDEEKFELKLNDQSVISIPYDSRSSLPIAEVLVGPEPEHTVNLVVILDESNQNLTVGEKLLLEWHYRFCRWDIPDPQDLDSYCAGQVGIALHHFLRNDFVRVLAHRRWHLLRIARWHVLSARSTEACSDRQSARLTRTSRAECPSRIARRQHAHSQSSASFI
jgi:hypothetical protein